jgi:hypothetical protein
VRSYGSLGSVPSPRIVAVASSARAFHFSRTSPSSSRRLDSLIGGGDGRDFLKELGVGAGFPTDIAPSGELKTDRGSHFPGEREVW